MIFKKKRMLKIAFKRALFVFFILFSTNSFVSAQIRLNDSLIAYLPLNGTGLDISGKNNNAIISTNGVYSTSNMVGIEDRALLFNGSLENGQLDFGSSLLNNHPNFSMSFWFNPASLTNNMSLVGQDNLLEVGFFTSPTRLTFFHPTSGSFSTNLSSGAGVWQHVVIMCSPLNIRIFINGIQSYIINGNYSLGATTFPTRVGGNVLNQSNNTWFRGAIDELRFYNRLLSNDEIQLLSSSGSHSMVIPNMPGQWCSGQSLQIPFATLGNFDSSNVFTLQLSDEYGSFTKPINLQSKASMQADTFMFVVPSYLLTSSGYRLRIISSFPLKVGAQTSQTISISNAAQTLNRTRTDRLVWYKFNANSADSSGNNKHATALGTTSYTTDRHGNVFGAIELNGTSGFVQVPAGVWFNNTYTVSCWVKPNSASSWARLYDFGNGSANDNVLATLFQTNNNRQQAEHYIGTSSGGSALTQLPGLRIGQWNHYLVQYDGSILRVYINGWLSSSAAVTMPRTITRNSCFIGRSNWSSDAFAHAAFDDFIIFNRALSENEIMALANDGAILTNGIPCSGGTLQLRAPIIDGASYIWSGPSSFSSNKSVAEIDNVTSANSGIYQLVIKLNACDSAVFNKNIVIPSSTGLPSISFNTLPPVLNTGSANVNLSATPAGGIFTGSGISGNIFSPSQVSAGIYRIGYSIAHTSGCMATNFQQTQVFQGYNMSNGTIQACNGGFYDQGGSADNYLANQNNVQTFCSGDTINRMQFQFSQFNFGFGDTLFVYDGSDTNSNLIAYYIQNSIADIVWSSGTCLTFQFKSDASNQGGGWLSTFSCMPAPQILNEAITLRAGMHQTCSAILREPGGTGNYFHGYFVQTFRASPGTRLRFTRSMMAINGNNGGHWLRIFDGPTTAFPMISQANNFNWADPIAESTGEYLTFVFDATNTNAGTSLAGFEGSLQCFGAVLPNFVMGQGLVQACNGMFTDNGGLGANYSNEANLIQTFKSNNPTSKLRIQFNQNEARLNSGDTLFVFDGTDTTAQRLAAFVQGSRFEPMKSKDSTITFKFTSNASTNDRGWQGFLNCVQSHPAIDTFNLSGGIRYTDSAIVYDPGGTGNYSLGFWRQTFGSYNGNRLRVQFTELNVNGNNDGHWVRIYDGPNSSFPLIGSFNEWAWPQEIIESSGKYLTIEFDANNTMASTRPGFTMYMHSTSEILGIHLMDTFNIQTCRGVFYDSDGPNQNYRTSYSAIKTICADSGRMLRIRFNHITTQIGTGDTLFVFDGPDITSKPLAVIIQGTRIEPIYADGRCLSFLFKSDASNVGRGWQGFIECDTLPKPQETILLSAGTRYVCNALILDPGGNGNYPLGFWRQTFGSYNGNKLILSFTQLNVNGNNDGHWVRVYDGPNNTFPLLGSFNEWAWPSGPIESSNPFITIEFDANNTMASTRPGFAATLSCGSPLPLQINMQNNSKIQSCDAVFYDNNGPNNNYSHQANLVQTICADSAKLIRIRFNHLNTQFGTGDSLFVYDGDSINNKLIAVFIQGSRMEPIYAQNQCITFYFKSDITSNGRGWQGFISCDTLPNPQETILLSAGVRYVCNALLLDPGGTGNYPSGFWRQTFASQDSTRLLMTFSQLNVNGNNGGHWINVFDGPNNSFPLIGSYNEWSWPQSEIRSSGRFLTVEFNSTNPNASSRPGFTATLSCADPIPQHLNMLSQTVQTCHAVYHDSNGPNANYPHNDYKVQTICGDTNKLLSISFRQNASRLAAGDTLIIYDGRDTFSQRLAVYHSGSTFDNLKSIGECFTFVFKSDANQNDLGWQGFITCDTLPRGIEIIRLNRGTRYTCNAIIRDNGGTDNYPRGTDALYVQTFGSYNGNRLQLNFSEFNINSSNSVHWLRIYDGPSTQFPLIGAYNNSTGNPGIVISSGRYLTIEMDTRSTNASAAAGFTAELSCITPILPQIVMNNATTQICEAVFYDNGGATGNYQNSSNNIHTLSSSNNQLLQLRFNHNNTQLMSGDTLFIYDGDSINDPLLGVYVSNSILETICSSGPFLTFRFKSDGSGNGRGWQAFVSCVNAPPGRTLYTMSSGVRHTCNGLFTDPGGNGNYPQGTWIQTFRSYNGQRIRAVRQAFSLSTSNGGHWLDVYDGADISAPLIGSYNNSNLPPVAFQSSGNALTFRLRATANTTTSAGWEYIMSCFSGNTIDVDWISSPLCQQSSFSVPFTRYVTVASNNIYTVQLSDSLGNFGSPINIGTLNSTDSTGIIAATIPTTVLAANGYRIRVVSSNPVVLGSPSPNSISIIANPVQPVISNLGTSSFCNGIGSTILSINNQAGINYRWTRNDSTIGTNSNQLAVTQSGLYKVELFNGCDTILSTQSINILNITAPIPQTIVANGDTNICSNANVQFSVASQTGVNYQWYRNDTIPVGSNSRIFTTNLAGSYKVILSNSCGISNSTNRIQVNIIGNPPVAPNIMFSGSLNICSGDSVYLYTPNQSNVSYQWKRNGLNIGLDTNFIYAKTPGTYSLSVSNQCSTLNSIQSRLVSILPATTIHSITIPDTLCNGGNKTLSVNATGAGSLQYQWFRNADTLTSRTTSSFQINGFTNNDTGYYYVRVIGLCGTVFSDSTYLGMRKPGIWVGGVSNSWSQTANWNCPIIPDSSMDVYIPAAALFMPFVNGHREVRNLHIENGTFVNIIDSFSSLNMLGQITGGGKFNHTAGTIILSGNQVQHLPGGTYHSIRINNQAGVSLQNNILTTDTIHFQKGMIWAGEKQITLGSAKAAFAGFDSASYVKVTGLGGIIITHAGNGSRTQSITIPIGKATYNPLVFGNTGVIDTFTVKLLDTIYSNYLGTIPSGTALSSNVVNRTWIVEESIAGGSNATIGLFWNPSNETTGFSRNSSYIAFYNGTHWNAFSSSIPAGVSLFGQFRTGLTQLNVPFGIGSNSVLPVSLLAFNARYVYPDAVALNWKTAIEINNNYFTLERSFDLKQFDFVTQIFSNSIHGAQYNFVDALPNNSEYDKVYYRLSQTDRDGTKTILGTRLINLSYAFNAIPEVNPNPFKNRLSIDLNGYSEPTLIQVFNSLGKLIYQYEILNRDVIHEINTEAWIDGFYTIKIGEFTKKLIKTTD